MSSLVEVMEDNHTVQSFCSLRQILCSRCIPNVIFFHLSELVILTLIEPGKAQSAFENRIWVPITREVPHAKKFLTCSILEYSSIELFEYLQEYVYSVIILIDTVASFSVILNYTCFRTIFPCFFFYHSW